MVWEVNHIVAVFFTEDWDGVPTETEEMNPKWFKKDLLPFDSMWPDDIHWLPLVLRKKLLEAEFLFGENDTLLDFRINEVSCVVHPPSVLGRHSISLCF